MRFVDPRQDAGEGFGFQEESEAEALLKRVSTLCALFSDFDKPCDCNQRIAAAGQFRSSFAFTCKQAVDVLTRMSWNGVLR